MKFLLGLLGLIFSTLIVGHNRADSCPLLRLEKEYSAMRDALIVTGEKYLSRYGDRGLTLNKLGPDEIILKYADARRPFVNWINDIENTKAQALILRDIVDNGPRISGIILLSTLAKLKKPEKDVVEGVRKRFGSCSQI